MPSHFEGRRITSPPPLKTQHVETASAGASRHPPSGEQGPAPSRRLRQDRSVETREKLILAAIDLLNREGYATFSTPGVARLAGVSRGALQYHFDTRESLLVAVRARLAMEMSEAISPSELSGLAIPERVATIVDHYWRVFGSPRYVATLEIRIFERLNDDLSLPVNRELDRIAEPWDMNWVKAFPDSPLGSTELVLAHRFMLDAMRGLAMRQIETQGTVSIEPEIGLLRRMLVHEIVGSGTSSYAEQGSSTPTQSGPVRACA